MSDALLIELGLMVIAGILVAGLTAAFRQPLIIGYIVAGILLGPNVLNIVTSQDAVGTFAKLGIVVLLFMVGLSLSPKVFKEVGKISLITGMGQIIVTTIVGFIICNLLGFSLATSLYVSVALTFSSTIIITKLLSDKGDLDTLYGRISVGFLLVQDVVAMILLVLITSMSQTENIGSFSPTYALKIAGVILGILLFAKVILPAIMRFVARSQEYLLMFSIGWCLLFAITFYKLNFSMEIGALLAGILLAASPYKQEISSKMKPLRDFFIFLFFIHLGTQMSLTNLGGSALPVIIFSLYILIGNPLIMIVLMTRMGYSVRTGFMAGLTVAQISEFSLILITLGVGNGQIPAEILSMVTLIGLITITGSTYAILYADRIYPVLAPYLAFLEPKSRPITDRLSDQRNHEILLFGYDKIGFSLLKSFHKLGKKFLVVDYNPEVINFLAHKKINHLYGDASNIELLDQLSLHKAKMVISTIPKYEINTLLIKKTREYSENTIIIVVSNTIDESLSLYEEGATYVIIPRFLGGEHASALIEKNGFDFDLFIEEKMSHMEYLGDRKALKHSVE